MKRSSDIIGIAFFVGAIIAPFLGFVLEGGNLLAFLNLPAFVIVFGGTILTSCVGADKQTITSLPKLIKIAFTEVDYSAAETIRQVHDLALKLKEVGGSALQPHVNALQDPFLRQGMNIVINKWSKDQLHQWIEASLEAQQRRHAKGIKLLETMGGFAPTFGIIGTVMGLINVLSHLDKPEELGGAVAVAFIATFMGVGSASLFYYPLANRLRLRSARELEARMVVASGVLAVHEELNALLLVRIMAAQLPPDEAERVIKETTTRRRRSSQDEPQP